MNGSDARRGVTCCVISGAIVGGSILGKELPDYRGDYEITPGTEAVELETRDMSMRRNLTVKGIPYCTTTNTSGGYTAVIGG